MVEITMHYHGELRCSARHEPSGTTLSTDAPVDNQGKGESFSPTDLVATALGTCMLTTMGIVANREGYRIDGLSLRVEKHMSSEKPRRIARLVVDFTCPSAVREALDVQARSELERAADSCPVRISLLPAIEVPVTFDW